MFVDTVVGILLGLSVAYFFRAKPAQQAMQVLSGNNLSSLCSADGPDRDYVRFTYTDGRVEVRKINVSEFAPVLDWRGRRFRADKWTPDGHVYLEK